jgi:hypothetical protein
MCFDFVVYSRVSETIMLCAAQKVIPSRDRPYFKANRNALKTLRLNSVTSVNSG